MDSANSEIALLDVKKRENKREEKKQSKITIRMDNICSANLSQRTYNDQLKDCKINLLESFNKISELHSENEGLKAMIEEARFLVKKKFDQLKENYLAQDKLLKDECKAAWDHSAT